MLQQRPEPPLLFSHRIREFLIEKISGVAVALQGCPLPQCNLDDLPQCLHDLGIQPFPLGTVHDSIKHNKSNRGKANKSPKGISEKAGALTRFHCCNRP